MNLCTNSAHAMEKQKGVIRVNLENVESGAVETAAMGLGQGSHVRLSITDNGCGIDAAIIDKVFDPYFTTKAHGKGTGIGLAQAHGIVKSHHGEITVKSAPGAGTRVDIFFPAMKPAGYSSIDLSDTSVTGKERILFVDDEKARQLKIAAYIMKPVTIKKMTRAIRTVFKD